jgi:O-antigen ligase
MFYKTARLKYQTNAFYRLPRKERLFGILFCFLTFSVLFRLTILVRRRLAENFGDIDSMAVIQLSIVGLSLFLIAIAPRLKASLVKQLNSGNIYIISYYLFAILTALWSGLPNYTAYRAIEYLTLFYSFYLFIFYSPTYLDAEIKVLYSATAIILLDIGKHIKLGGISLGNLHTNSYSAVAAMLACYCIAEFFSAKGHRRANLLRIGVVSTLFLIIGTSSASIVSFFIGLAIISFLHRNKIFLFIAILSLILCISLFSFIDLKSILFLGKSEHDIMTLTGRTHLWKIYMEMFLEHPFIGNGFAASTRLAKLYTTNTHNGFISVALGTGFAGLTIFLIGVFRIIKASFINYKKQSPLSLGIFSALVVGLINNMAISIIGEQWSPVAAGFACFLSLHIITNPIHKPFRRIVL